MQLIIKPIEASLTHDTQAFGRMDPYLKVYFGGMFHRSATCQNGGKNPHWNDTFNFSLNGDQMLRVEVWDNDAVEDDLIGSGSIHLGQYIGQGVNTTIWVDLIYNGRQAGRVCFALQFGNNMGMGMGGGMGMNTGMNMGGYVNPMVGMGMGMANPMMGNPMMGNPMMGNPMMGNPMMGGNPMNNNGWGPNPNFGGNGWNNGW